MKNPRDYGVTLAILALVVACGSAIAGSAERLEVTSIRSLLLAAISNGEAHGVLNNDHVAETVKLFRTTEPLEIDVKRVRDLPEPGCKRLEVTTTLRKAYPDARGISVMTAEEKVRTKNGTIPQDVSFKYQISFCSNGKFPKAAKDLKEDDE